MFKVDLHTHSVASPDGALNLNHYKKMLEKGKLDCVAVTDHNTVERALKIQKELGADKIIVGEEINTSEGEIIGLYLTKTVPPKLTAAQTIQQIHDQKGLVYIPHPFETVRKGVSLKTLDDVAKNVDLIEIYNGRSIFQDKSLLAIEWSVKHKVPGAASSDSHGYSGWGRTYTILKEMPTKANLARLIAEAKYQRAFPGLIAVVYPKVNRIRKKLKRHD